MKKWLVGIFAIVVLLILVALVVPFLIPTNTYKTRLVAAVTQATGRSFTIDGPVQLSLLPQFELEANDVKLGNAAGMTDPDMIKLKSLEVRIRVMPLLHGTVEIGKLVLDDPVISLEVAKDGHPNWVFAPANPAASAAPAAPAAAPAASSSTGGGAPVSQLSLGDVHLTGGQVTYRDDRTGATRSLSDIDMALSLPDLDQPLSASGSAVWNGEKVSLAADIAKPRALLNGASSNLSLKLEGRPLTLAFAGSAGGLPQAKLGGTIDLAVPSVRDLATWLGTPLAPGGGLQQLAIKGALASQAGKFSFSDASIALDAINAKGAVSVDTGGARPAIKATLEVDKLDLNPYLPPETPPPPATKAASGSGGAPAASRPAPAAGWSDAPIDLSGLNAADADLALRAGGIVYRKIVVGASALDIHLQHGKLVADLSQLALYQGSGKGKVTLDGSGATPAVALSFDFAGLQIQPFLVAAAGFDRLTGTGKLALDVAATGKSQRALVNALGGKGALDLANGQIKGVNLLALAENATASVTGANANDKTDFGSLTGTFTITKGIVKNDDLQLKSGIIPITGAGTVSLPERNVNYRVTASLAGAVGVPVLVTGPWDNLSYRPDVGAALKGLTQQPGKLLDTVKGAAGSAPNPTGLLKGLFGK